MRAFELTEKRILEGGNAVPNAGAIHISEIEPTIKNIEKITGLKGLSKNVLGSVGKKEYSGDIDLAINLSPEEYKALGDKLETKLGKENVNRKGTIFSAFPIIDYDPSKDGRQPRTGVVQVDFMNGDPEWLKLFHHSPGDESVFKGAHRNLALASLAAQLERKASEEMDDFDRPVWEERWQWSVKHGLIKVRKESRTNENTGKTIKAQSLTPTNKGTKNAAQIAKILFKGKAGAEALNSMESIIDAIKKSYTPEEAAVIFERMAWSLSTRSLDKELPPELEQYRK